MKYIQLFKVFDDYYKSRRIFQGRRKTKQQKTESRRDLETNLSRLDSEVEQGIYDSSQNNDSNQNFTIHQKEIYDFLNQNCEKSRSQNFRRKY